MVCQVLWSVCTQSQNSQGTEAEGSRSWYKPGLHCQTLAQKKKKSTRKVRINVCLIEECVFFLYHLRVSILINILILIKNTSTAVIIYCVYVLCPTIALWYLLWAPCIRILRFRKFNDLFKVTLLSD